ncbi:molecular chaperone [Ramlibacter ginsenosidimutans]|uniref:Molecular chaperone n=1 Tax=Ramlibacter ginsenosidimutans TaxID=502333 RepID=A0A934TSM7_9BURK|nr:molecular chaperone [Ramlibacter ginsenosidimutans]
MLVEFGPKQKIATVRITLSDQAIKPMRLQAQLLQWRQDLHGAPVTKPSEELIVTPRIAELKPGQQQVLRLALRGSLPAETERAYRLVLEDIAQPSSMDVGGGAAINFRMAYDLPVMVAPRGTIVSALRWRDCPADAAPRASKGVCVRIANAGNRRVKVQSVTVSGDGWQQALNLKEADAVLAGAEREWVVPATAMGPVRGVEVRTATGQVLRADPAGG